ncbi:hypothetical protein FZC83_06680 [Rossellomorea marisflavi]|uniref:YtxH domain-containing protein n=1 Tax=Rossellomorea marisflavi TaxID=189381 RepID=A0A5D4RXR5_9BACI|nr:hypothetical protein [Rossellomorea marisflavi]KQU63057.1 hypothetical protein ASG66_01195 [Bacillus sp. Leaf406]MDW4525184.1 hypothetical protein [Rossellomorea marisflavi]TYS54628.1 hypothetical protein FZC83_06680 [Rossellomorea marisflavi]UKS65904.1 hypothetical protein K6T23_03275 [Rossellomorea marisflavi]WJV18369.1 hypothetical protein QU593_19915 [Rossellomorea marisflavi]
MGKSKFFQGVLLGAVAGGLLSLLDKTTRREVGASLKNGSSYISTYAKDPKQLVEASKEVYEKLSVTADQVTRDFRFISEKVDELKGMTPQVKDLIEETKETFEDSSEAYKEAFKEAPNELEDGDQPIDSSFKGY